MLASRVVIFSISLFIMQNSIAHVLNIQPESVNAQAWLIYDPQTKQIIAEHNSHQQRAPASLTKMMVAYIVLKDIKAGKIDKNQIVHITNSVNQIKNDESKMDLAVGEQVTIDQLLAGLIIMSANDAAVTLAEVIGEGDIQKFIHRMNEEAQQLGMTQTSFANPSGITMEKHYSTAYDLNLLSLALIEQTPDYLNYSKQQSFHYKKTHEATNLLLAKDSRVDGLKTGFTSAAGYNLALTALQTAGVAFSPSTTATTTQAIATQTTVPNTPQTTVQTTQENPSQTTQTTAPQSNSNQTTNPPTHQAHQENNTPAITIGTVPQQNRRLIVVVLGTPSIQQRAEVSHKLLNLAFEYTQNQTLIKKRTLLTQIPIINGYSKQFTLYAPHDYQFTASLYPQNTAIDLKQFNLQTMRLMTQYNGQTQSIEPLTHAELNYQTIVKQQPLYAPFKQQDVALADVQIMQNEHVIHQFTLLQNFDLKPMTWWQKIIKQIQDLFK